MTAAYELSGEDLFVLHLNTARDWRGGERQVFFLAREIQRHGGRQLVVGQPASELETRCAAAGLPFEALRMRGEWDLPAAARLARMVRERGVNLLHAHTAKAHTLALLARRKFPAKAAGVPGAAAPGLVVSRRVDFPARLNFLSRRKYLSPLVDRYIAISENVRGILETDGIAAEKIRIAYSGIDLADFASLPDPAYLRDEFGIQPDEIVLGNVAALVEHKDQRTLLRAFAVARQGAGPVARLFILGQGPLRAELEELARELGVADRVVFTGFRRDVPAFLKLFDLFVMSSQEEGLGTAVLDAMAAGLPVAATRGGGIPEMIDQDRGGLLAPVGDAQALGAQLRRLIASLELREKFGAYNRERVKDFGCDATFRATVDIYREVLKEKR